LGQTRPKSGHFGLNEAKMGSRQPFLREMGVRRGILSKSGPQSPILGQKKGKWRVSARVCGGTFFRKKVHKKGVLERLNV
jgi:hypothetical protein